MNHRLVLLVGFLAVGSGGAAGAACSSSSNTGSGDDSTAPMDAGGMDSTTTGDSAAHDTGTFFDSGPQDSGVPLGDCSAVGGSCDIVAQNCQSGQECDLTTGTNGDTVTACEPTQASESIQKGYPCCPGQSNPCLPGLECNGQTECTDGAAPTGVCAARCCGGDDTVCGMTRGGVAGHCDIGVVDNDGGPLYNICDYSTSCKPFGVQPCPTGQECLVTDMAGTSTCTSIFNAPGVANGGTCDSANACVSGDMCLNSGSTGTCIMLCLVAGSTPPFSTAGLANGPGTGGCPTGYSCNESEVSAIFPPWLGICIQ
jgi:hypothetical protein